MFAIKNDIASKLCLSYNTNTVELRYNAVLGVHGSNLRYIRVERYNAVSPPPHPIREWPVSAVDRLILLTYLLYRLPYLANTLLKKK